MYRPHQGVAPIKLQAPDLYRREVCEDFARPPRPFAWDLRQTCATVFPFKGDDDENSCFRCTPGILRALAMCERDSCGRGSATVLIHARSAKGKRERKTDGIEQTPLVHFFSKLRFIP